MYDRTYNTNTRYNAVLLLVIRYAREPRFSAYSGFLNVSFSPAINGYDGARPRPRPRPRPRGRLAGTNPRRSNIC